jgi:hypothetical protein
MHIFRVLTQLFIDGGEQHVRRHNTNQRERKNSARKFNLVFVQVHLWNNNEINPII